MKLPTYPDAALVAKYDLESDQGRFVATGNDADKHMWRVPTLRNLVYTAPYSTTAPSRRSRKPFA